MPPETDVLLLYDLTPQALRPGLLDAAYPRPLAFSVEAFAATRRLRGLYEFFANGALPFEAYGPLRKDGYFRATRFCTHVRKFHGRGFPCIAEGPSFNDRALDVLGVRNPETVFVPLVRSYLCRDTPEPSGAAPTERCERFR